MSRLREMFEETAAHDFEVFGDVVYSNGLDMNELIEEEEHDEAEAEAAQAAPPGVYTEPAPRHDFRDRSDGQESGDGELDESWQRVDLGPALRGEITRAVPDLFQRDDGVGLFTLGRVNGIHGDSGLGKSITIAVAVAQQLNDGRHVIWIDLEEPNASVLVDRLRDDLSMDPAVIEEQLHYYGPRESFSAAAVKRIVDDANAYDVAMIVIDSLGEAFSLEGINEDKDVEVGPWLRRVARPLTDAGPAVVVLDHSTKAADNPLHPSGSKRKRAAITGQSYLLEAPRPLTREHGGELRLTCAKDRHGYHERGKVAATLEFARYPDGGMTVHVVAPASSMDADDAPDVKVDLAAKKAVVAAKKARRELSQTSLLEFMAIKSRRATSRRHREGRRRGRARGAEG